MDRQKIAAVVLLSIISLSLGVTPGSAWNQFRNDTKNTGSNLEIDGPSTPVHVNWTFDTEGDIVSSPAVVDGVVFVGSDDGRLYALNAQTGEKIWSYETGGKVQSSPSIVEGIVYVGSNDGGVYALDATDGEELWRFDTDARVRSSPKIEDGILYVGSHGREYSYDNLSEVEAFSLYALDAENGEELWRFPVNNSVISSPAVYRGSVFFGGGDGYVYSLDSRNGEIEWRFETGYRTDSSPAVAGGTVYIGSRTEDGTDSFYAIDSKTGEKRWGVEAGRVVSSPAVANGTVYVGSYDGNMYAVAANSGEVVWTHETSGWVRSSPAIAGDLVYFGNRRGNLTAVDLDTGEQNLSVSTDDTVFSSPAVYNETVYFGSRDGKVYAITEIPENNTNSSQSDIPRQDVEVGGNETHREIDSNAPEVVEEGARTGSGRLPVTRDQEGFIIFVPLAAGVTLVTVLSLIWVWRRERT